MVAVNIFKNASLARKEKIFKALSEVVEKATGNTGAKIQRIEDSMTRYQVDVWNRYATKANRSAVLGITGSKKAKFTKTDANKVLKTLDRGFKGIDNKVKSRIKQDIGEVYMVNKKSFIQQFKLDVTKAVIEGEFVTAEEMIAAGVFYSDELVIAHLARLQTTSIGNHFPKTLRPHVQSAIQRGVIEKGLNKEQAGKFLQKELTRKLGGKAFINAIPPTVQAQGQASTNAYFKGLSATNVNFASNFSQTSAMVEARIERYEIVATLDRLTSIICRQMNGRQFEMKHSVEHVKSVMESEDVEALKEFAPWRRDLKEFGLKAGEKLDNVGAAAVLAEKGMSMPPYHFRCRTEVHPA